MINSKEILKYLLNKNVETSILEIEELIEKQDREDIKEKQKNRFRYEIWDKKLDINGVSAKDIIQSRDYDINQAYLIYIDNILVYFQDHNPNKNGYVKITKKEVSKLAEDFIDKKVEENTDNIIADKVIETILSKK